MKFEMAENSLFAILLRSQWWISVGIAAAVVALSVAVLPPTYAVYGAFGAIPFLVIASIAGWRQWQAPSAARVAQTIEAVRAMSWKDFSNALELAFRGEGYEVRRLGAAGADLELTRHSRVTLVSCKRWKVARTGIEPLRELSEAASAREAHDCIYVATSEVTDNARRFAAEKSIRLLQGVELVRMLPGLGRARKDRM